MDDKRGTGASTVNSTDSTTTDGDKGKDKDKDKDKGRGCGCWIVLLVILLAGAGGGAYFGGTQILRQETPLPLEPEITDLGLRWLAIPAEYADMRIPSRNPDIITAKGKELYKVQCALCHGQSGNGDGEYGATMYPKASNLHDQRVRSKSDGQLFWIIAHGINLTGMPAWGQKYGGGNADNDIWSLVKYIREDFQDDKRP